MFIKNCKTNLFKNFVLTMLILCILLNPLNMYAIKVGDEIVQTSIEDGWIEVCVSVEKFVLGQGYLLEPVIMRVPKGTLASEVTIKALEENGLEYDYSGQVDSMFYLSAIEDNDFTELNVPSIIGEQVGEIYSKQNRDWLREFDYTGMSGWMFTVNNKLPEISNGLFAGAADYVMSEGDVIRWQFTVYGYGSDLGIDGFGADKIVSPGDKDNLMWKVASSNNINKTTMEELVMPTLCDVNVTQEQVDNVLRQLLDKKDLEKERVLFEKDGYKYITGEDMYGSYVKAYDSNEKLIEMAIKGKDESKVTVMNFTGDKTTEVVMDFGSRDNQIKMYSNVNKESEVTNHRLGRATLRSYSPFSTFKTYNVDVRYEKKEIGPGVYTITSGTRTVVNAIAFLMSLLNVPASIAGNIWYELAFAGIVTLAQNTIIAQVNVPLAAEFTEYEVIGKDSRDKQSNEGIGYGTKATIIHAGSEYFNKTFVEGVDIKLWGKKLITYGLIREIYPGLYSEMEVIKEVKN